MKLISFKVKNIRSSKKPCGELIIYMVQWAVLHITLCYILGWCSSWFHSNTDASVYPLCNTDSRCAEAAECVSPDDVLAGHEFSAAAERRDRAAAPTQTACSRHILLRHDCRSFPRSQQQGTIVLEQRTWCLWSHWVHYLVLWMWTQISNTIYHRGLHILLSVTIFNPRWKSQIVFFCAEQNQPFVCIRHQENWCLIQSRWTAAGFTLNHVQWPLTSRWPWGGLQRNQAE